MLVFQADRKAIGKDDGKRIEFTQQVIQLETDDVIYLFSDGYADQLGGANQSKFMRKLFREYLISIGPLPMSEQRTFLLAKHEEWRGKVGQTDDVCVMGVRVG